MNSPLRSLQNPLTRSTPARLYQERSEGQFRVGGQMLHIALEIPLAAFGPAPGLRSHPGGSRGGWVS